MASRLPVVTTRLMAPFRGRFDAISSRSLGAVILAFGMFACTGSPSTIRVGDTTRVRWIEHDPQELLYEDELLENVTLVEWSFADIEWRTGRPDKVISRGRDGLLLGDQESSLKLFRWTNAALDDVRVIEVQIDGASDRSVVFQWRSEDEPFDATRSVRMTSTAENAARGEAWYRTDLDQVPGWTTGVAEIRLGVRSEPGSRPLLRSFTGYGKRLRVGALHRLAAHPQKVEVDHEVRNSYFLVPGQELVRRLEVMGPCDLRFALGSQATVRQPFSVRLVARWGEAEEVLLETGEEVGGVTGGHWVEHRVSLAPFSGRTVDLVFSATASAPLDLARGVPVLANPEVLAVESSTKARPSVLLVSVDALRADHLSLYGYTLPTSPNLDAWARRAGTVFQNVVAPSPWTLPSHVSMFTGLDAAHHGVNHDVGGVRVQTGDSPNSKLLMMAEILRDVGFATGAFTGGAYMNPRFGFAQGFDVYGYWPDRARDEKEIATGVDRALAWMEAHLDEPFLYFLHTYEVHDPYRAREPHFSRLAPEIEAPPGARIALVSPPNQAVGGFRQSNSFVLRTQGPGGGERPVSEEELPLVSAMYDSGISHMDAELGRLFDGIEDLGLADRLLVVITADHGEALGEYGLAGHIYPYDCNLLIPMVVSAPDGRGAGRVIKDQVQLVDLLPTVLDAVDFYPLL